MAEGRLQHMAMEKAIDPDAGVRLSALPYAARLLGTSPSLAIQSLVLTLFMAVVNLPLPMLNLVIFDAVIPAGDTWGLVAVGIFAFAVRAVASAFQVLQNYVIWRLMTGISHNLRMNMSQAILRAEYPRYVDGSLENHIGRLTSDVEKIEQMIFNAFRFVLRPMAMIILMAVVMFLLSPMATALVLVIAPLATFASRSLSKSVASYQREVLALRQKLQGQTTESFDCISLIRSFKREDRVETTVTGTIDAYTDASVSQATRERLMQGLINLITFLPGVTLICYGAWSVQEGTMTLGTLMAFIAFEQLLRSPLGQFSYFLLHVKADMTGPERVEAVRAEAPETPEVGLEPSDGGAISFENVMFGYTAEKPVLRDFTLSIKDGERIALVGPSGAGKSTILNLLLGFYKPQNGRILINGTDAAEITRQALRQRIGVVFQDNPMFDASIGENLRLGTDDIPDAELWAALDQADAGDFVRSLPEQLDTLIGVKGLKLSGGQRQRLAIARVLLRDPRIVIFDEATSSLDSVSEHHIRVAMDRLLKGRTSITIAHRLGTVVDADRICYLENGQIVESGHHGELLKLQGRYHDLYRLQVGDLL